MTSKLQGPGLAEIQKAERRERRADQQRQLEIQEKQMRALAAAAEVQDTVLKWNAAPIPVKSFAEIQAEEAKRLANEQLELQKKKEQDAHNSATSFSSGASIVSGASNSSSNVVSIWSGNKIWGTAANTAGFWEEPLKHNNKTNGSSLSNNNNINNNSNLTTTLATSQSNTPQKLTSVQSQMNSASHQQASSKNIKKSQSVAVMQNAANVPAVNNTAAPSNQKKSNNSQSQKSKSQKSDSNGPGSNDKKSANKNNINTNSTNKCDDYEADFVNWCTKSLNNMNTKVDGKFLFYVTTHNSFNSYVKPLLISKFFVVR